MPSSWLCASGILRAEPLVTWTPLVRVRVYEAWSQVSSPSASAFASASAEALRIDWWHICLIHQLHRLAFSLSMLVIRDSYESCLDQRGLKEGVILQQRHSHRSGPTDILWSEYSVTRPRTRCLFCLVSRILPRVSFLSLHGVHSRGVPTHTAARIQELHSAA